VSQNFQWKKEGNLVEILAESGKQLVQFYLIGKDHLKIIFFFFFFFAFSHVQMGSAFVVDLSISFRVIALRPTGFG
jgi:hypothetical protein